MGHWLAALRLGLKKKSPVIMNRKIRMMKWPEGNRPRPRGQFFCGATALLALAEALPILKTLLPTLAKASRAVEMVLLGGELASPRSAKHSPNNGIGIFRSCYNNSRKPIRAFFHEGNYTDLHLRADQDSISLRLPEVLIPYHP